MGENNGLQLICKPVPQGWIVLVAIRTGDQVHTVGVTYVPDPGHEWQLEQQRALEGTYVQ